MPRKSEVTKREIGKDPKYHDALMAKLINGIMRQGKKYVAETIFYNALDILNQKTHADPAKTFKQAMENVLDFVVQGNTAQMRDPAFVRELKDWLRFNEGQAARRGDGLFSGSSGNPSAPSWLGGLMFDFFFTEKAENDKYARHVRSSAGIAVFVSELEDKNHRIEAGRAFQRFALQATAMDVRTTRRQARIGRNTRTYLLLPKTSR